MFDFQTEKGKTDAVISILLHHYTKEQLSEFYGISIRIINEWIVYRPTSGAMYIGWKHIR